MFESHNSLTLFALTLKFFHSRTHFSHPSWSLEHGAHDTNSIGEKERNQGITRTQIDEMNIEKN